MPASPRVPAIVAIVLLLPGMVIYFIAAPWVCFDVCPRSFAGAELLMAGLLLGPGLLAAAYTAAVWLDAHLQSADGTSRWSAIAWLLALLAAAPLTILLVADGHLLPETEYQFYLWSRGILAWCLFVLVALVGALFARTRPA